MRRADLFAGVDLERQVHEPDVVVAMGATARTPYSNELRAELADEIHAHYPEWENWAWHTPPHSSLSFSRDVFERACEEAHGLTCGRSASEILESLYDFSILGFGRARWLGRDGTDEYWRFRNPGVTFDSHRHTSRSMLA